MEPNSENTKEQQSGQTPTEGSKRFLRKVTDWLFTNNPGFAQLGMHIMFGGGAGSHAVEDAIQGNYASAVVEGIIAGVLAISPIRRFERLMRLEK